LKSPAGSYTKGLFLLKGSRGKGRKSRPAFVIGKREINKQGGRRKRVVIEMKAASVC